jgi:RHS repeat-associated protein
MIQTAVYNANNQLTQWGSTPMSFDLNGNTLNDGTNSYVWDARNRLVSADGFGASFAYDPLGRRVSKTISSTTTSFLYDGVNAIEELNGAETASLLTGGVDERFTRVSATETDDYLTGVLGSTVALTDGAGNSQVQYSYDPYGGMSIAGSTTNSYAFTGREFDGLGIDYYRARYYNPLTGRFLSEDPMGFGGGMNFYTYGEDDPTDLGDPFGLQALPLPPSGPVLVPPLGPVLVPTPASPSFGVLLLGGTGEAAGFGLLGGVLLFPPELNPGEDQQLADMRQKQADYDAYQAACSPQYLPASMDPCAQLSRQIDHAERCAALMQAWDAKWLPGRHDEKILTWLIRAQNFKDEYSKKCVKKCRR